MFFCPKFFYQLSAVPLTCLADDIVPCAPSRLSLVSPLAGFEFTHDELVPQYSNAQVIRVNSCGLTEGLLRSFQGRENRDAFHSLTSLLLLYLHLTSLTTPFPVRSLRALPCLYNAPYLILCFYAYNFCGGRILPAEHPHEDKLYHVAVEEEKLCSSVARGAIDGLHAACWGRRGGVGKEDVFEGTKLEGF